MAAIRYEKYVNCSIFVHSWDKYMDEESLYMFWDMQILMETLLIWYNAYKATYWPVLCPFNDNFCIWSDQKAMQVALSWR